MISVYLLLDFCNPKQRKKMNLRERFGTLRSRVGVEFQCRIATQTILSEVVKVVQVNNATNANIARTVLLPSTTYKAYLPNIDN